MDIAKQAARTSGEILRNNIRGVRTVTYKGDINLVTEMDMMSERAIVKVLRSVFPDHSIVAEEETDIRTASPFTWIIDPLDGTTNYAHGYPCFSVSLAQAREGDVILGVVYDPMRDELFSASKSGGAYLNGEKIAVSKTDDLIRSLLATGFPYDRTVSEKNNLDYFQNLLMASQEVRRDGSAALDLCYVAMGRFDGFWELKLKPWDVAAGSLILAEAGGVVTDLSGYAFDMHAEEILATNGLIHKAMLEIIYRTKDHERR
ncbi:MAG TPA: inositol monophosphatase family protein [Nitrospirota bacterium]|nr:inositol monophosphatase family protein [Nitrospirota bacterium]